MKKGIAVAPLLSALAMACGFNQNDPFFEQPIVSLTNAPPPIVGGTLLATRDRRYAVLSDPDRERIVVVDLSTRAVRAIPLEGRAEPGRLVEDAAGRVYVALREGGALLAVDPASASITARHEVCATPRGLAWDREADALHVACADGWLVSLGPDRERESQRLLAEDLRDVVVTREGGLLISRFRSAEVFSLRPSEPAGELHRLPIAAVSGVGEEGGRSGLVQEYAPNVAVRVTPADDGALVLHQRARVGTEAVFAESAPSRTPREYTYSNRPVRNGTLTWRDPCDNAVVHAALTLVGPDGRTRRASAPVPRAAVPVDVAVSPLGRVAIAFAAEPTAEFARGPQVVSTSLALAVERDARGCLPGDASRRYPGQVVAVAFSGEVELVQLREPARLVVEGEVVELGGASVRDTGHDLFHVDTGGAIACASCHPGGGDDGHVWQFAATRPIRTLPLEGTIGLIPYHRDGTVGTFFSLMDDLQAQMDIPTLNQELVDATEHWLRRLPLPPSGPVIDPQAVDRGRAIFESAAAGCASCHRGELGTDGRGYVIGGRAWQTPPLRGVALRAPYLHDGRAPDLGSALLDAGSGHGSVGHLDASERADLEAYVRSR